jgi:hypothetical protein
MFQALKSITTGLCPKTIMIDFEKAAMNAINYEFPETKVKGCCFRFSQCIWRQVQDAGLQTRYKDDVTFALQVRKLPSLAYVPENEVINAYNNLLETTYFTEYDELLSPIHNYFDETWIGCMDRRQKEEHLNLTFEFGIAIHWFRKIYLELIMQLKDGIIVLLQF